MGLQSNAGLNGSRGRIVGFVEKTGRVRVELASGKYVGVKASNLQAVGGHRADCALPDPGCPPLRTEKEEKEAKERARRLAARRLARQLSQQHTTEILQRDTRSGISATGATGNARLREALWPDEKRGP